MAVSILYPRIEFGLNAAPRSGSGFHGIIRLTNGIIRLLSGIIRLINGIIRLLNIVFVRHGL